ncbi:hypothetical protein OG607_07400 [Streptomyces sp. NBC_01537]
MAKPSPSPATLTTPPRDAERFAAEEAARVAEVADAITLGPGEA